MLSDALKNPRKIVTIIAGLAAIGVAISAFSWLHNASFVSGEFCTIGGSFNCDIVNKGPFSKILGVPVALIGVLGYLFMLAAALLKRRTPEDRSLTWFLILASAGALAFSLYLTAIEAFVLHAWCILCLSSQITIALIFVLSLLLKRAEEVKVEMIEVVEVVEIIES